MFRLAVALAFLGPLAAMAGTQRKPTCAVLDFTGKLGKDSLLALSDTLRSALAETGRFRVQSKGEMLKVIADTQEFNKSDACDESCAVETGRMLQVQFLVAGHVDRIGSRTLLLLQLTNVETGEIQKSLHEKCDGCSIEALVDRVESMAGRYAHSPRAWPNRRRRRLLFRPQCRNQVSSRWLGHLRKAQRRRRCLPRVFQRSVATATSTSSGIF